jgi:hypothetical protein
MVPPGKIPTGLSFPLQATPADGDTEFGERIESGLDSNLHAPTEYVWNVTFERTLPKGAVFSASYIGRTGRSLLAHRDAAAFNDIRDPQPGGLDWYAAGTALEKLRQKGTDISQIPSLISPKVAQYFDHVFPAGMASIIGDYDGLTYDPTWTNAQAFYGEYQSNDFFEANDWTDVQAEADLAMLFNGFPLRFMQPQYGTLSAWSTVGNSTYNALTLSLRQRLSGVTFDFNYTFSHSLDDASGLQSETAFGNNNGNGSFIVNPLRPGENYASSDFDVRHSINADAVWALPFGKGRTFLGGASKRLDAVIGGWQLSGIFRWNTGLPVTSPIDDGRWATNWDNQANVTPVHPIHACSSRPSHGIPNLFGNCDITAIYQNFRNAYPGESGPRNYLRYPGYFDLDLGLGKAWKMPWNESHELQLRWDTFNVTNTQHLTGFSNDGVAADPGLTSQVPPSDFYNFTQIQGNFRVMQIGARYSF